jgi:hypothetical protein
LVVLFLLYTFRTLTSRIRLNDAGIGVRNRFSSGQYRWDEVARIRAGRVRPWQPFPIVQAHSPYALTLETKDGATMTCWASAMLQTRNRDALKGALRSHSATHGFQLENLDALYSGREVRRNLTRRT